MRRRLIATLAVSVVALGAPVALANPAAAATKGEVLSSWTQTSSSSYNAWASARNNQSNWASYNFDWSTDYCSSSPDNPLGFNFKMSCARHDFGYRNYKDMGTFNANKTRLDNAFYEDLKRVCNTLSGASKTACNGTAWTYYQAVKALG